MEEVVRTHIQRMLKIARSLFLSASTVFLLQRFAAARMMLLIVLSSKRWGPNISSPLSLLFHHFSAAGERGADKIEGANGMKDQRCETEGGGRETGKERIRISVPQGNEGPKERNRLSKAQPLAELGVP